MTLGYRLLLLAPLAAIPPACGEEDPPADGEHYPLAVGDFWVYEETDAYGDSATLRYEVTGREAVNFPLLGASREVFVVDNTFPGTSDERRTQYIEDDGVRAARLGHVIFDDGGTPTKRREYDPGFLRFDRSRVAPGESWTEDVTEYTDTMDGAEVQQNEVQYRFEVLADHEKVTVPAGTFDCLVLERSVVYGSVGDVKVYYFAPGVGKVKEITENDKEEDLVEYEVGGDDGTD
jgi:hypothetical protein